MNSSISIDKNLYELDSPISDFKIYDTIQFRKASLRCYRCLCSMTTLLFLFLLSSIGLSSVILLYIIRINNHAKQLDSMLSPLQNDSEVIHEIETLIHFARHYINCSQSELIRL